MLKTYFLQSVRCQCNLKASDRFILWAFRFMFDRPQHLLDVTYQPQFFQLKNQKDSFPPKFERGLWGEDRVRAKGSSCDLRIVDDKMELDSRKVTIAIYIIKLLRWALKYCASILLSLALFWWWHLKQMTLVFATPINGLSAWILLISYQELVVIQFSSSWLLNKLHL